MIKLETNKLATYIFVFFYSVILFINYTLHEYDPYKKNIIKSSIPGEILYKKIINVKLDVSNDLSDENNYSFYFDRKCEVTGDLHDRHKVRWVKQLFLKEIFQNSKNIKDTLPYYLNALLHGFLIFLTFFIIKKTFNYNKFYDFLFLLYITFIFQLHLGEYSYSIFEMFFLSLSLYCSKNNLRMLFILSCILAVLNRESGFLILMTWFIFNEKDYKFFGLSFCICLMFFVVVNFEIFECLIQIKYFLPFEDQLGQIDLHDIPKLSMFSISKLIFINFLIPFGLFFYYFFKSKQKNIYLLALIIIYLLVFLVAMPLHHIAPRLILLPLIFASIHYKEKNYIS